MNLRGPEPLEEQPDPDTGRALFTWCCFMAGVCVGWVLCVGAA